MPTYDVGRVRHAMDLMHSSFASNGSSIPSNWIPAATGDSGIGWQPGGSVSYGSNSSYVAEISIVGVRTDVARSDHYHGGVNNITSSSSNTLQRGTVNFRAGANIAFGASDTDGDGEFDTLTISASATGGGGGGGSGITHSYLGYNTAGGSFETMTTKVYAKKITVSTAGVLTSIGAYMQSTTSDQVGSGVSVAVYDDSSGTPNNIIAHGLAVSDTVLLDNVSGAGGVSRPRWFHRAVGVYLTAGDYWIAVQNPDSNDTAQLAFDGSGSDRTYTSGGGWMADWGFYTPTTTSNKYSIRASIIS